MFLFDYLPLITKKLIKKSFNITTAFVMFMFARCARYQNLIIRISLVVVVVFIFLIFFFLFLVEANMIMPSQ